MMDRLIFRLLFISAVAVGFLFYSGTDFSSHAGKKRGIPPNVAADYIHAVIQAGRRVYSENVVERLAKSISLKASENWQKENTLLLPAQFLSKSAEISDARGIAMKYRLLSLWPVNKNNGPKSESEKKGLQEVIKNPDKPFVWYEQSGRFWYLNAIYPDKAINKGCVSCHNSHPQSPKNDFKKGDVMGGILINFPVGRDEGKVKRGEYSLPPLVVSEYIHTILNSDRYIYSKYIVDRLQNNNILHASENWREDNSLLLPAQFLLNSSRLVKKKNLGLDFRLISLWPINPQNAPANEFEQFGLESVVDPPYRPYIDQVQLGEKRFFQAIYPDSAVAPSCITCHNSHEKSPKNDFKLFEVMGGLVITLDLNDPNKSE
ncbi:MAG: DUF3365 domain-containing protein [Nitrospinales bacterium]